MEEELGIQIRTDQLACLSRLAAARSSGLEHMPDAMFPSTGGCDEHVTIYSHERRVLRSQLKDWVDRLTGLRTHGEKSTLKVVPMNELWQEGARDAKCLGALALWEGLRREGKV